MLVDPIQNTEFKMVRVGGVARDEKTKKGNIKTLIEKNRVNGVIEMVIRLDDLSFSYKEFIADKIKAGTKNFSSYYRITCSCDFCWCTDVC